MAIPKAQTILTLKAAAEARSRGASWAQTAQKIVGAGIAPTMTEAGLKHVRAEHKAFYEEEYERAYQDLVPELEAEAILKQRSLMRKAGEDIAQRAAHSILAHVRGIKGQRVEMTIRQARGAYAELLRRTAEEAEAVRQGPAEALSAPSCDDTGTTGQEHQEGDNRRREPQITRNDSGHVLGHQPPRAGTTPGPQEEEDSHAET